MILNSGYNTYQGNSGYYNSPYRGNTFGTNYGGSVYTPITYTSGRGRMRFRYQPYGRTADRRVVSVLRCGRPKGRSGQA